MAIVTFGMKVNVITYYAQFGFICNGRMGLESGVLET